MAGQAGAGKTERMAWRAGTDPPISQTAQGVNKRSDKAYPQISVRFQPDEKEAAIRIKCPVYPQHCSGCSIFSVVENKTTAGAWINVERN